MANYKRRYSRTKVKCALCTPNRNGNSSSSTKAKYRKINKKIIENSL